MGLSDKWQDVIDAAPGTVFEDRQEDGIRFVIIRGPAALCAYVGVPLGHPLADHEYDDIPITVHGGLTYAGTDEKGAYRPSGWYFYGWDYAHMGDRMIYEDTILKELRMIYEELPGPRDRTAKAWTPKLVDEDSQWAVEDFKRLARLAEKIREGDAKLLEETAEQPDPELSRNPEPGE